MTSSETVHMCADGNRILLLTHPLEPCILPDQCTSNTPFHVQLLIVELRRILKFGFKYSLYMTTIFTYLGLTQLCYGLYTCIIV